MFEFGFKSDTGRVRNINQDSFFILPENKMFFVADGVGGHTHGELASRTAVSEAAAFIKDHPLTDDADDKEIKEFFSQMVTHVNKIIYDIAKETTSLGMATTLLILYLRGEHAYVVNVGDSRAYLIRNKAIMKVTEDHTFVNEMVKKGVITEEQAMTHPDRNMITRAVGADDSVEPDFYMFKIYENDILLMCSDGLYNELSEQEICEILLTNTNMRYACNTLISKANMHGGNDNITALSIRL